MIIKRETYLQKIRKGLEVQPIVILIGARQVGKTSLMQSIDLQGKTKWINGQDPEIMEQFSRLSVLENWLRKELDKDLTGTLLIDEFQFIPQISTFLKLLVDKHKKLKIICSGSSSLDIFSKITESMAGRVRIIPVYSLSFREYLLFIDNELAEKYSDYKISDNPVIVDKRIAILMNEYLLYGGLPGVALLNTPEEKRNLLQDIYQTYLLKDVRSFIKNQDFVGFNKMLKLLASQIGNFVNINELSSTCGFSYTKCEEYVQLLEQMYILKFVYPYTTNKRREITKMKKVYFYDIGSRNIISNNFSDPDSRIDNGAIFENFIYLELVKEVVRADSLYFYRTLDGLEIDFIIENAGKITPVEVKFKNFDKAGNISRFKNLQVIQSFDKAYLINRNNNRIIEKVQYLPGYFTSKMLI